MLSILRPSRKYTVSLISDIVRSCKRLIDLHCPLLLDSAAWTHLSNLPTLVKLTIEEQDSDSAVLDEDNLNLAPFLNVTTLRFVVKTATDLIEVMQRSEFPSLNSFCMIVDILLWEEVEQLFRALSRCGGEQVLDSTGS
ncbi:hypothetical protein AZE42_06782 [Rhizopogon vesiculosus]|uniref:Uncharacterized protein n=1 Tax=Rhizopogon vesiculosus TaxID=180088 RepID=A0A1J8QGH3_9AGAM|nr:hypothetical protein AZE42_06782 [Rhizopogon vesiculosus]